MIYTAWSAQIVSMSIKKVTKTKIVQGHFIEPMLHWVDLWPFWMKPPNCTSTHLGEQLFQIILKSIDKYTSYGPVQSTYIEVPSWKVCLTGHKWAPQKWSFNPFPNKPWSLCVCNASLLKTMSEKKKMLVTSNFFFSHSLFYPIRELSVVFIKFKLLSANSFSLEESKICRLGKG